MAITVHEKFSVRAPVQAVWDYLLDPNRVVGCMQGAALDEIESESAFLGSVKVAVGPITMSYKGRVQFTDLDEANHRVEMTAEGREGGGGTARGTMSSSMEATADGQTQVTVDVSVDVTGRIVQLGRGLMQDVAQDLFRQFVSCVQTRFEIAAPDAEPEGAGPPAATPVAIVPLVLRAIRSAIGRLVRRIFRRPASK